MGLYDGGQTSRLWHDLYSQLHSCQCSCKTPLFTAAGARGIAIVLPTPALIGHDVFYRWGGRCCRRDCTRNHALTSDPEPPIALGTRSWRWVA
jgi:hypothetical protein